MLTDAFLDRLLADATALEVSDGDQGRVASEIVSRSREGTTLTFQAEFDADAGNFDWRVRRVIAFDGTVIDEVEEDMGRKASPSVWNLEVRVDFSRLES